MSENIKHWLIFIMVLFFFIALINKCEAQVPFVPIGMNNDYPDVSYSIYGNGKDISIGEEKVLFIYGNEMFGFKDGGFPIG